MKLDHIALDRLSISPANMRARKPADIANILPSVRERGVLVPLLVRSIPAPGDAGGGEARTYEIVAGRRRYLAAKAVAEERGEAVSLPCGVIEAGDDAAALEASLIENVARLDPDEVNQWESFARLVREGRGIEDVAATFGVAERQVRRVLALGNLLPRIRSLYRQERIDAATIRHLTMASKARQREWLALYDRADAYAPTGHRLRQWLFGGHAIPASAALFDLAAHPLPVVADLFGEDAYFADAEAFWRLQNEAIAQHRQAYLDAGWSAVEVLEPGTPFQSWEHERQPKENGGKVIIAVSPGGDVEFHEGWLSRKEARRARAGEDPLPSVRPEMTAAMRCYVDLHRHAAVRTLLLDHPALALRALLAHAIAGSHLWSVRPEPQRCDRSSIAESIRATASERQFGGKRREVLALLGLDAEAPTLLGSVPHGDAVSLFDRLVALSDQQVLAILALVMGESLAAGSAIADTLGCRIGIAMADLWQADEAFLDLLRDREVLLAMVGEVAGEEIAAANADAKSKGLKAILRDCLAGANGRPRAEGWVPAWLRFPQGHYTARGCDADDTADTQTHA